MQTTWYQRFKNELNFIFKNYISHRNWSLKEVGEFWDSVADANDINESTYSYFRRFTDGYDLCSIAPKSRILDICARTGNGTMYFHERGRVGHAVCVDVSRDYQDICTDYLQQAGVPAEHLLIDDYQIPQPDESFDAILCFETVEHVSEPQELLTSLRRLLKPYGEIIITTPNFLWEPVHWLAAITGIHRSEGPHRFLRRHTLRRLIKKADLKIITESTTVLIPGGPAFLIKFGEFLEHILPETIKRFFGLRRIFICTTNVDEDEIKEETYVAVED
ncbi:methyltransferase domain-containing protein [candidate division KSB1 bacterium]|nr:methyltransferase domain-containing protein [candidate division KSB1 bacterium]